MRFFTSEVFPRISTLTGGFVLPKVSYYNENGVQKVLTNKTLLLLQSSCFPTSRLSSRLNPLANLLIYTLKESEDTESLLTTISSDITDLSIYGVFTMVVLIPLDNDMGYLKELPKVMRKGYQKLVASLTAAHPAQRISIKVASLHPLSEQSWRDIICVDLAVEVGISLSERFGHVRKDLGALTKYAENNQFFSPPTRSKHASMVAHRTASVSMHHNSHTQKEDEVSTPENIYLADDISTASGAWPPKYTLDNVCCYVGAILHLSTTLYIIGEVSKVPIMIKVAAEEVRRVCSVAMDNLTAPSTTPLAASCGTLRNLLLGRYLHLHPDFSCLFSIEELLGFTNPDANQYYDEYWYDDQENACQGALALCEDVAEAISFSSQPVTVVKKIKDKGSLRTAEASAGSTAEGTNAQPGSVQSPSTFEELRDAVLATRNISQANAVLKATGFGYTKRWLEFVYACLRKRSLGAFDCLALLHLYYLAFSLLTDNVEESINDLFKFILTQSGMLLALEEAGNPYEPPASGQGSPTALDKAEPVGENGPMRSLSGGLYSLPKHFSTMWRLSGFLSISHMLVFLSSPGLHSAYMPETRGVLLESPTFKYDIPFLGIYSGFSRTFYTQNIVDMVYERRYSEIIGTNHAAVLRLKLACFGAFKDALVSLFAFLSVGHTSTCTCTESANKLRDSTYATLRDTILLILQRLGVAQAKALADTCLDDKQLLRKVLMHMLTAGASFQESLESAFPGKDAYASIEGLKTLAACDSSCITYALLGQQVASIMGSAHLLADEVLSHSLLQIALCRDEDRFSTTNMLMAKQQAFTAYGAALLLQDMLPLPQATSAILLLSRTLSESIALKNDFLVLRLATSANIWGTKQLAAMCEDGVLASSKSEDPAQDIAIVLFFCYVTAVLWARAQDTSPGSISQLNGNGPFDFLKLDLYSYTKNLVPSKNVDKLQYIQELLCSRLDGRFATDLRSSSRAIPDCTISVEGLYRLCGTSHVAQMVPHTEPCGTVKTDEGAGLGAHSMADILLSKDKSYLVHLSGSTFAFISTTSDYELLAKIHVHLTFLKDLQPYLTSGQDPQGYFHLAAEFTCIATGATKEYMCDFLLYDEAASAGVFALKVTAPPQDYCLTALYLKFMLGPNHTALSDAYNMVILSVSERVASSYRDAFDSLLAQHCTAHAAALQLDRSSPEHCHVKATGLYIKSRVPDVLHVTMKNTELLTGYEDHLVFDVQASPYIPRTDVFIELSLTSLDMLDITDVGQVLVCNPHTSDSSSIEYRASWTGTTLVVTFSLSPAELDDSLLLSHQLASQGNFMSEYSVRVLLPLVFQSAVTKAPVQLILRGKLLRADIIESFLQSHVSTCPAEEGSQSFEKVFAAINEHVKSLSEESAGMYIAVESSVPTTVSSSSYIRLASKLVPAEDSDDIYIFSMISNDFSQTAMSIDAFTVSMSGKEYDCIKQTQKVLSSAATRTVDGVDTNIAIPVGGSFATVSTLHPNIEGESTTQSDINIRLILRRNRLFSVPAEMSPILSLTSSLHLVIPADVMVQSLTNTSPAYDCVLLHKRGTYHTCIEVSNISPEKFEHLHLVYEPDRLYVTHTARYHETEKKAIFEVAIVPIKRGVTSYPYVFLSDSCKDSYMLRTLNNEIEFGDVSCMHRTKYGVVVL